MEPASNTKSNIYANLALVAGIFGLFACNNPPYQLLLGASAIMLAIISKKGGAFPNMSVAALILGIVSVVCSFLLFFSFVYTMHFIEDPANAQIVKQVLEQMQGYLDSLQTQ